MPKTKPFIVLTVASVWLAASCTVDSGRAPDGLENLDPPTDADDGQADGTGDGDDDDGSEADDDDDGDDDDDDGDDDDDDGDVEPKFDIGDAETGDTPDDDEELEFSYIWIANSMQGTVSKIDTQELVEEGRYIVRDDSNGNPSRTSVNLNGDAAVANRSGGITKMWALPSRCEDTNGTVGIQTSSGRDDVLAWGEEECIAWYTPMEYASQRPIAWTRGTESEDSDGNTVWVDQKLWVAGIPAAMDVIDVIYLDGDSGDIERVITIPYADVAAPGLAGQLTHFSAYGGAVDGGDNFWFHPIADEGKLVRVSASDFTYRVYDKPYSSGYGLAVDENGRVWSCHGTTERFDPSTETWEQAGTLTNTAGCMADAEGRLWAAGRGSANGGSIVAIDIETLEFVVEWDLPEMPKGISIDFDGYVWGVAIGLEEAYKIDPATGSFETYTGLDYPYTYSDMTGFALSNAGEDPVE